MTATRRFKTPWTIDEQHEYFIVSDATGQALCHMYFEDQRQRVTRHSLSR
jgi:hypothetical protein